MIFFWKSDERLFIDSLHIFGRALFLVAVVGLALQKDLLPYDLIQVGEMIQLVAVLSLVFFDFVLITHNLNLFRLMFV